LSGGERTGGGQRLDHRDVGRDAGEAVVAAVVGVVREVRVGFRAHGGGAVVERAGGVDRRGHGDDDVRAAGDGGDGAGERRATAAADVGDGEVRRRVGDLHGGGGRRTGVGHDQRVLDRLAGGERADGGQRLDHRDVGRRIGRAAVADAVGVVARIRVGFRADGGGAVVEGAGGHDRRGDGDGRVRAAGQRGDGAGERRATAAADVGDGQVRRRVGDLDAGGGRRSGVGDEQRVLDRLAGDERTGGDQRLDHRDVGRTGRRTAVADAVGVVARVRIAFRAG